MRPAAAAQRRPRIAAIRDLRIIAVVVCVLAVIGGTAAAAVATSPDVASRTPQYGTSSARPTVVVFLRNADSLREEHVHASIDGKDVSSRATVRDGAVVLRLGPTSEGTHVVRVWTDRFGVFRRRIDTKWKLVVDTTAPKLELGNVLREHQRTRSKELSFDATTDSGARISVRTGAGTTRETAGSDGEAKVTAPLAEGRQRVTVVARDRVGNETRQSAVVLLDSTPPKLTFAMPKATRVPTLATSATVDDATAVHVSASVDGKTEDVRVTRAGRAWRITRTKKLSEGLHGVKVTARDALGNASSTTAAVLVNSSEQLGDNAIGRGARGRDVRQLHERLSELGSFKPSSAPREWRLMLYGPATSRAVREFQDSRGLDADGVAGDSTIAALTLKIVINRAAHTLTLYRNGKVFRTYGVAVGSPQYPTPAGSFRIIDKQVNPTWNPPDSDWAKDAKPIPPGPDNPLGTRWMGLNSPGVGIHGTNSPASIGYSVSHGCIRMRIPDVEALFELVTHGTPVTIV